MQKGFQVQLKGPRKVPTFNRKEAENAYKTNQKRYYKASDITNNTGKNYP